MHVSRFLGRKVGRSTEMRREALDTVEDDKKKVIFFFELTANVSQKQQSKQKREN